MSIKYATLKALVKPLRSPCHVLDVLFNLLRVACCSETEDWRHA
jgi:hypothetical protein